MDTGIMTEIGNLIASIGFPCVMCIIMMYYIKYINDIHKDETNKLSDAINALKEVLIELRAKLEGKL